MPIAEPRIRTATPHGLEPPPRLLLGPGPSTVHPRVYEALAKPVVGHLDPAFLEIMDQLQEMLRSVFRTANPMTFAVSGTGTAGMESCLANLIEPGDEVLVCVNGVFGTRMCEMVERLGGSLRRLEAPWGEVFETARIAAELEKHPEVRLVAIVHAETSTGARQDLVELGALCRESDRLLLVDAVTSLGGIELEVDRWGIDACYSGTQKCLSCPPGLAPVTFGPRAVARLAARSSPVKSWYLDFSLIQSYWAESQRAYHHTAPISMVYGLHQALAVALEEGLEARFERHARHSRALLAGLARLGLEPFAPEGHRLPMLNSVRLPEGIDEAAVRRELLDAHGIEIGGGLGPLAGAIWRIGLMGESARRESVTRLLGALGGIFARDGRIDRAEAALDAAEESYRG